MKFLKITPLLVLLGLISCHDKVKEPEDQACFNPIDLKTEGVELVDATHPASVITMAKDLLNPKDNLHKYGVTIAVNQKLYNLSADTIQLDSIRDSFCPPTMRFNNLKLATILPPIPLFSQAILLASNTK